MLIVAGIHAIGSLGAMTYFTATANLRQLHRTVADRPLSMVIESQFVRSPLRTLSAHALTEHPKGSRHPRTTPSGDAAATTCVLRQHQ
jgi:hypothetical protein